MHEHESLVRALDECARTKNYQAIRDLVAPDVVASSPSYDLKSADALVEAIRAQNELAVDIATTLTVGAVDDKVFWEWTWTGTYPALGKTVTLRGLSVAEVENGRLAKIRQYWDNLGIMTELGLLPSPS